MGLNISPNEIVNASDGFNGIAQHACTSTEGIIAWVIVGSIWLLLLFLVLSTDEKHWAVGVASFVALIFAIGFAIFGCGGAYLIILSIVLSVLGLAGGFVVSYAQ